MTVDTGRLALQAEFDSRGALLKHLLVCERSGNDYAWDHARQCSAAGRRSSWLTDEHRSAVRQCLLLFRVNFSLISAKVEGGG
jgi:hypothetical protein